MNGDDLTDEMVERYAAEAEAGYDPEKLRPRRAPLYPYKCGTCGSFSRRTMAQMTVHWHWHAG